MPLPDRAVTDLPLSAPGMRIGLFGGSFDPPHGGHLLVALQCLKRLALDAVWLLVSPGNPLKQTGGLAPLADRVAAARTLADHPRLRVTGWEADRGLRYSADTLSQLREALPGRRLVWIMGLDNLQGFHRWQRWRFIADTMPIAVYARPGVNALATAPALHYLTQFRLDETDASRLPDCTPPAWVLLHGAQSPLSSTELRRRREVVVNSI